MGRAQSCDAGLINILSKQWEEIPDVRVTAFINNGRGGGGGGGGGGGQPVQLVLGGPNYDELARWRDIIIATASENPGLTRLDSDLRETQPQVLVRVDTDRAASLGITARSIGSTLQTMMSERQVTTYVVDGEEYDVVLQAKPEQRATYSDLRNIFVRSDRTQELIPLSNLTKLEDMAGPSTLNRHNRMRAVTISANLTPGYTLGEGLDYLENLVHTQLPSTAQIDYKGESLEYKEASGALYFTFGIALFVVFLVLAAQFESFVHPLVIMVTVPLAVAGAVRALGRGHDAEHLQPDRHHHARRHRGEEWRADRRVHQPDARPRARIRGSDRRGVEDPLPARDHDGVLRGDGVSAVDSRARPGCGEPVGTRRRDFLRASASRRSSRCSSCRRSTT